MRFVCHISGEVSFAPEGLKQSECGPLFMNAYRLRNAGAVIHSHSKAVVIATLVYPGNEFIVTHLEMIKVSILDESIIFLSLQ